MPLHEIHLTLDLETMPPKVTALIDEADRRAKDYYAAGLGLRYPKYVPSDPRKVHAAIARLKKERHLRGDVFCEWGCGFGIATGIASLLGMEAYGIEIEEELAGRATQLAADLKIPVTILQTSYLPEGFDESDGFGGTDLIMPESRTTRGGVVSAPEYDGLDPEDVDLFYVYPWPGQEQMMMDLFEAVASDGAILLMFQEDREIVAYLYDEAD